MIVVGIGEMKLARGKEELITYALGSCVGVTMYDPIVQVGGLLHVMLPEKPGGETDNVFRYADSGIEEMLRRLKDMGFVKERAVVKIAGGARMFGETGNFMDIGNRNVESVRRVLEREGLKITAQDIGGSKPRTVSMATSSGMVSITCAGMPTVFL